MVGSHKVATSIALTERQSRWLDQEVRRLGVTKADVIRRLLDREIDGRQDVKSVR